jgi:hypothetical protein
MWSQDWAGVTHSAILGSHTVHACIFPPARQTWKYNSRGLLLTCVANWPVSVAHELDSTGSYLSAEGLISRVKCRVSRYKPRRSAVGPVSQLGGPEPLARIMRRKPVLDTHGEWGLPYPHEGTLSRLERTGRCVNLQMPLAQIV